MPNDNTASPVDSASSSISFDADKREITLEQKPGEQPVTIAGAAHGPETESDDGEINKAASPDGDA